MSSRPVMLVLGSSSPWRRNILTERILPLVVDALSQRSINSSTPDIRLLPDVQLVKPDIDEKAVTERSQVDDADNLKALEHSIIDAATIGRARAISGAVARAKMVRVLEIIKSDASPFVQPSAEGLDLLVITSDQVVLGPVWRDCDDGGEEKAETTCYEVREKPADKAEARQFIQSYSGRTATTYAAVLMHRVRLEMNAESGLKLTTFRTSMDFQTTTTHFGTFDEATVDGIIERGTALGTCGAFVVEDEGYASVKKFTEGGDECAVQGLDVTATTQQLLQML